MYLTMPHFFLYCEALGKNHNLSVESPACTVSKAALLLSYPSRAGLNNTDTAWVLLQSNKMLKPVNCVGNVFRMASKLSKFN